MYVHNGGQRHAQRAQVQDAFAVRVVHRLLHHALGLAQHDTLLATRPQSLESIKKCGAVGVSRFCG